MAQHLHHRLHLQTAGSFCCHDITTDLQALIDRSGISDGLLVATGQHTTTALALNENEERLLADIERFFLELAAPERPWLHNHLHLRPGMPSDEPRNSHVHLIALTLGNQLPAGGGGQDRPWPLAIAAAHPPGRGRQRPLQGDHRSYGWFVAEPCTAIPVSIRWIGGAPRPCCQRLSTDQ
ncbi:YjbQ family protein [Synechococcus sp. CCY9202]|uniref:YjbQ family protein n=1 Tax=Synechococcus sp. CCY9202 TaxID=174698 RepID=UPI003A4C8267